MSVSAQSSVTPVTRFSQAKSSNETVFRQPAPCASRGAPARRAQLAPPRAVAADAVPADAPPATDTATEGKTRKPSPLATGGTLKGNKALGKDASKAAKKYFDANSVGASATGFSDPRWKKGTWDLSMFKDGSGETDWDAVIDAEVRRKALESLPEECINDEPVVFDTAQVPWWAWTRRFHLPEAEKVNGRAAMVGFAMAYLVEAATGHGLVEQMDSFLGKLLLGATLAGCMLVRNTKDVDTIKGLADEATFYDKQWASTWEGVERPSETQK